MPNKPIILLSLVFITICSACTNANTPVNSTSIEQVEAQHVIETEQPHANEVILEEEREAGVVDAHIEHHAALSSDGIYRIESFGVITDVTAGGLYPAEGIRLIEIETGEQLWSTSPGYYTQSYLWSPNNRYVAVYMETRISGETFVVDTESMTDIPLPFIEQVRNHLNTNTTVNEFRPDPYFKFMNWLDDDQLSVTFQWNGIDGDGYEGIYLYSVSENILIDVKLKESSQQ